MKLIYSMQSSVKDHQLNIEKIKQLWKWSTLLWCESKFQKLLTFLQKILKIFCVHGIAFSSRVLWAIGLLASYGATTFIWLLDLFIFKFKHLLLIPHDIWIFFFHFIFICDANLACLRLPKVKILTIHLSHLPTYIEANISDITKVERWVKSWLLKFRPRSYSTIELLNNLSHIES